MVTEFIQMLCASDRERLIDAFQSDSEVDRRLDVATLTLDPVKHAALIDPLRQVLDRVLDHDYSVREILIQQIHTRYQIHADSTIAGNMVDHVVILPLLCAGSASTVFFKNHWHGPRATFTKTPHSFWSYRLPNRRGGVTMVPDLRDFRNKAQAHTPDLMEDFDITEQFLTVLHHTVTRRQMEQGLSSRLRVSDYSKITGWIDQPFSEQHRQMYLPHIAAQDLHGLTLDRAVAWQPGSAMVFDGTQLHCSGNDDFGKIGITVMTSSV